MPTKPKVSDPEYYSQLGVSLFNEQKYAESIEYFDNAIELDDENPNYFNLRGHARYACGDSKGARSDFNKSKKLKSKGKKNKKGSRAKKSLAL